MRCDVDVVSTALVMTWYYRFEFYCAVFVRYLKAAEGLVVDDFGVGFQTTAYEIDYATVDAL